jgi:mRNA interferase RelE/StbE
MRRVSYSGDARNDLARYRNRAEAIIAKIRRYAETGAGDVKPLAGHSGVKRLRIGDFRVIFEEDADTVRVTRIGPRGDVYEER